MSIERKLNPSTGTLEFWWCEWEKNAMAGAKTVFINKTADEAHARGVQLDSWIEEAATCWVYGHTLGNIAIFSPTVLGSFPEGHGNDAVLPCDFGEKLTRGELSFRGGQYAAFNAEDRAFVERALGGAPPVQEGTP